MGVVDIRLGRARLLLACAVLLAANSAAAQTAVKVTLDWRIEGPAAPFFVAQDKGYYRAEGLDVTIEPGASSLEPINRVASGSHDIGFGDINALIKFRDQNAAAPVKAVFMVYNRPAYAIVARQEPRHRRAQGPGRQEAGRARDRFRLRAMAALRQGERDRSGESDRRERRHSRARADAGGRTGRCHHGLLVLGLHQRQGPRSAGQRYRRAVDGRARSPPLWQCAHRQCQIRRREARGREGVRPRLPQRSQGHGQESVRLRSIRFSIATSSPSATSSSNGCAWRSGTTSGLPRSGRTAMAASIPTVSSKAIEQIGLTFKFRNKPALADIFDSSFLPPAERATGQLGPARAPAR